MDKKVLADFEERLLEVNKVISKLDPSIKVAAFEFPKPYVAGGNIKTPPHRDAEIDDASDASSGALAELVTKFGSRVPHPSVLRVRVLSLLFSRSSFLPLCSPSQG